MNSWTHSCSVKQLTEIVKEWVHQTPILLSTCNPLYKLTNLWLKSDSLLRFHSDVMVFKPTGRFNCWLRIFCIFLSIFQYVHPSFYRCFAFVFASFFVFNFVDDWVSMTVRRVQTVHQCCPEYLPSSVKTSGIFTSSVPSDKQNVLDV